MSARSVETTSSLKRCPSPSRLASPGSKDTAPPPMATPHLWSLASGELTSGWGLSSCVPDSALKPMHTACGSVPCSARIVGETSTASPRPPDFPASMSNTPTTAMPPWCFTGAESTVVSVVAHSILRQPECGFFDFMAFDPIESMAYATACWSRAVSV